MPSATHLRTPRWFLVPVRILLLTLLFTLLGFAVSLFLGLLGMILWGLFHGSRPDLTIAYHDIAFPAALVISVVALVAAVITEVRHFRQAKALAAIERAG